MHGLCMYKKVALWAALCTLLWRRWLNKLLRSRYNDSVVPEVEAPSIQQDVLRDICIQFFIDHPAVVGGPGKEVEIDESKFGKRKYNRGRAVEGHWVFGGMERGSGESFLVEVARRDAATLLPIIAQHVRPGTTVYSDEWAAYHQLSTATGNVHLTVNHSLHFVDPVTGAHTQGVENAVSLISNSTSEANCPSQYCPHDYPMLTCTTLTSILSYLIQCDWVHSVVLRWERDNDVQLYGAPSSPKNSSEPITYMNGVPRYVHWSPSNDACGDPGTYYQVTGPQGIPVCSHVPGNITSCDVSGLIANVSHIDVWTVNCVGKSSPLRIPIPSWHATTSHPLPPSSTPGGSSSGQVS
eukprot:Em0006g510a